MGIGGRSEARPLSAQGSTEYVLATRSVKWSGGGIDFSHRGHIRLLVLLKERKRAEALKLVASNMQSAHRARF